MTATLRRRPSIRSTRGRSIGGLPHLLDGSARLFSPSTRLRCSHPFVPCSVKAFPVKQPISAVQLLSSPSASCPPSHRPLAQPLLLQEMRRCSGREITPLLATVCSCSVDVSARADSAVWAPVAGHPSPSPPVPSPPLCCTVLTRMRWLGTISALKPPRGPAPRQLHSDSSPLPPLIPSALSVFVRALLCLLTVSVFSLIVVSRRRSPRRCAWWRSTTRSACCTRCWRSAWTAARC